MGEKIRLSIITFIGILIMGGFVYGCYWVAKTVSYSFFYEDMVRSTVIEMVQPQYLRELK